MYAKTGGGKLMARTRQPEVSNDVTRLITQIRAMIGRAAARAPAGRSAEGEAASPAAGAGDDARRRRTARPIIRRNDSPVLKSDVVVQGTNALEVIELRIVLEPAIARLAAVRASPVQIAKILEAATTPQGVTRTIGDIAFPGLLATAPATSSASLYAFLRRVGSDHRLHVPMASAIERTHPATRPGTPRHRRSHRRAFAGRRRTGDAPARRVQREIADRLNAGDGLSTWPDVATPAAPSIPRPSR